jgi:hypothetical protein
MCIENERLIQIGNFIDSHRFIYYIFCGITAFITYYLYCCACCHKKKLCLREIIYILGAIIIVRLVGFYDNNMWSHFSISSFILLPILMKGDFKTTGIVYFIHGISQMLSLSIRDLPMYLSTNNTVTILLLSIDMYFWLLLMFIIFNYKKEE